MLDEANVNARSKASQAALAQAQADEWKAIESILADLQPILSSENLDAQLIHGTVLAQSNRVEVVLVKGRNVLQVAIREGSRGVAIKDFTLTPVR